MKLSRAIEIVLELAKENVIIDDPDLHNAMKEQIEAIEMVEDYFRVNGKIQ